MVSRRGRSRNWPAHLWPSAKGRIPTRSQTSTAAAGSALPRPISTTAQCLSSSSTSLAASFCLERQNNCRFATETSYPSHYRWGPYNSQSLRCRVCSYGKPRGWSCPRLPLRPAQPPQESSFLPSRHLRPGSGHRRDDGHVQCYLWCCYRWASLQEFRAFCRISSPKSRKCWWMERARFFLAGRNPCLSRTRSEEHTSELQSRLHLVCRLLLEKKKKYILIKYRVMMVLVILLNALRWINLSTQLI